MAARLTAYIVALIVGSTVIAGLIVGAQRSEDGPVDVMVVNGRVYTADGEGTTAEAVAIQGNKIVRVGTTREIERLRRPQTLVIDAKGGTVLPGFTQTDARLLAAADDVLPASAPGPQRTLTRAEELAWLRQAMTEAHRRGITSVQMLSASAHDLEMFDALRRDGALTLRVYGALAVSPGITEAQLDALDQLRARFPDDPFFKAGVARVTVDANDVSAEQVARLVTSLDKRNWQIAIEAHGDEAVAIAANAYQRAIATNPLPARGRRHRIDIGGILGPVDLEPFDELGVVHSPPAEPASVGEAIDAQTREAAWASFDDHRKGSLARDMLADVIILANDVLAKPVEQLDDLDVSVTIFDGKVVFRKSDDTDY